MTDAPFTLIEPARRTTCAVFAAPHSGRDYPADMMGRTRLDAQQIRSSEDAWIDRLFDAAPACGAPFLIARAPRAYVDLNRAAEELDPALIAGVRRISHNPRVSSGLGVIPRVVAGGRPIYDGKLGMDEARRRIAEVWTPYHDTLARLLDESRRRFGQSVLIDCHSMPHEALDSVAGGGQPRPDVVLGDRFGAAAAPDIVDRIEAAFEAAGLRVSRNMPFAGAYIAQTYGRPAKRRHAVQVELDRSLYMDEATMEPNEGFDALRATLGRVIADIADLCAPRDLRPAAE